MAKLDRPGKGCIAYDVHGTGEPIVILRGLGRTVKHWLGYERTLSKQFKVITLDLRGVGESTHDCDWTTSIFDLADDLVAVLDELGLEAAHILGVSLGGMVTLATGLRHPGRCLSLIVVNTSIAGLGTLRMTPGAVKAIATGLVAQPGVLHRKLVDVLVGSSCPENVRVEVTQKFEDIAKSAGLNGVTVMKQLVGAARFNVKRRLKTLRMPVLVVYGTDDLFVPNINSRKLVQFIPGAKLVPIEGGGHELTLDKGDELAEIVREWLRETARRRAISAG